MEIIVLIKKNTRVNKFIFAFFILISYLMSCKVESVYEKIEIPFTLENNAIILDAIIEGKQGRYLFDTGSTISYIDIGKNNVWYRNYIWGLNNGKTRKLSIYNLNKINFRDIEIRTKSWLVSKSDIAIYLKEEGYDGLLGNMVFEGYWCELSFSKNKIILHNKMVDGFQYYSPVMIENKYNTPLYIPVTIDGNEFYFMIDTGMDISFRFPETLYKYKEKNKYKKVLSNEEAGDHYLVNINSMSVLDEVYNDIYVLTDTLIAKRNNNNDAYKDIGMIGFPFLKKYDFLFDYRDLRRGKSSGLYYNTNTALIDRENELFDFLRIASEFGVTTIKINNYGIVVTGVIEDSVAHKSFDLRPGIIIIKINGKLYTEYSLDELRTPDFYKNIHEYTILEDDKEKTIVVQQEYEIPLSTR